MGEVLISDCFLPSLCAHSSVTSYGSNFKATSTISSTGFELDVCELALLGQFQVDFDALLSGAGAYQNRFGSKKHRRVVFLS